MPFESATATATPASGTTSVNNLPDQGAIWTTVCALDDILPRTGVCALLRGKQIAVVRPGDSEQLYALSNYDPFSKAFVLSRGIVGDKAGIPKITSPIYKQGFDLRSGQCLDDPAVKIPTYQVRVIAGQVELLA
jgi:nitrite reductase (NADH) small subunit